MSFMQYLHAIHLIVRGAAAHGCNPIIDVIPWLDHGIQFNEYFGYRDQVAV
jgi:hypothetical protein